MRCFIMSDFLNICFRTVLVLIILFFITKMMGKKQISELNFFDYVVGITIGSIAADISLDIEKDMIAGIAALFICIYKKYFGKKIFYWCTNSSCGKR